MPKVSIIMPVYNVENYLAHCLDSILAQTYSDFELICVNDGAKDSSREILQQYADKDARIKIIDQENGGAFAARNVALKHITGDYVQFVDADDAIEPQCLELAVGILNQERADMVYFTYVKPRARHNKIQPQTHDLSQIKVRYFNDAMAATFGGKLPDECMSWFKICRAELLQGLQFIPINLFEDICFTWDILTQRPRAALVNLPLYHYTYNGSSITTSSARLRNCQEADMSLTTAYEGLLKKGLRREAGQFARLYVAPLLGLQFYYLDCSKGQEDEAALREFFLQELQSFKDKGMLTWRYYLPICVFSVLPDLRRFKQRLKMYRHNIRTYHRCKKLLREN